MRYVFLTSRHLYVVKNGKLWTPKKYILLWKKRVWSNQHLFPILWIYKTLDRRLPPANESVCFCNQLRMLRLAAGKSPLLSEICFLWKKKKQKQKTWTRQNFQRHPISNVLLRIAKYTTYSLQVLLLCSNRWYKVLTTVSIVGNKVWLLKILSRI